MSSITEQISKSVSVQSLSKYVCKTKFLHVETFCCCLCLRLYKCRNFLNEIVFKGNFLLLPIIRI